MKLDRNSLVQTVVPALAIAGILYSSSYLSRETPRSRAEEQGLAVGLPAPSATETASQFGASSPIDGEFWRSLSRRDPNPPSVDDALNTYRPSLHGEEAAEMTVGGRKRSLKAIPLPSDTLGTNAYSNASRG